MARPDSTTGKQRRTIGRGEDPTPERFPNTHLNTLLLLAIAFIAQTAAAQVAPTTGTTISDATTISVPGAKPAQVRKATKPTKTRDNGEVVATASVSLSAPTTSWPVAKSLSSTLRVWAQREGWPAPQFLTQADWAVDVPGSIPGSIEDALEALAEGFGKSASRPRIEISANHVMVVSETGAE